jgi:hypothetical protein
MALCTIDPLQDLLDLLPTNTSGAITASNLRDIVTSLYDTLECVRTSGLAYYFESTQQTITSAGLSTNIAHGLPSIPKLVAATLVCQVGSGGDAGYAEGDVIPIDLAACAAANRGMGVIITATHIQARFGSDANAFEAIHKTTGVTTVLVNTKWKVIFKVWA